VPVFELLSLLLDAFVHLEIHMKVVNWQRYLKGMANGN
jgi:hypothetical protein